MITDKFLKQGFIEKILTEEAVAIKSLQLTAMSSWGIQSRSGNMLSRLKQKAAAQAMGQGSSIALKYAAENRFLDIPLSRLKSKKKRRYASRLYNRIVYGRVYGNLIARIKYGFTDELKEQLIQELSRLYGFNIEL